MTLDLDKFLQHELYLDRLASGTVNSVVTPGLSDVDKAIRAILTEQGEINNLKELNAVTAAVRQTIQNQDAWNMVTLDMNEMSVYEAGWQATFMGNAFAETMSLPRDSAIVSYVTRAIMSLSSGDSVQAGTWAEFTRQNTDSQTRKINSIIRNGYATGQTVSQINSEIKKNYSGIIKTQAETLTRTGFVHYASQANEAMIRANKDVLQKYYYVVTFDNRLSNICRALDARFNPPGQRFDVGDPKAPAIPAHFGCRSRRIAVPKGWQPQGERSAVGGQKGKAAKEAFERREARTDKKVKYRGKRDKNIFKPGQIKASRGYEDWLRDQPRWYIEDSLGVGKAKLFIDGAPLKSFSDMNGRPLTLAEVKERDNR